MAAKIVFQEFVRYHLALSSDADDNSNGDNADGYDTCN